MSHPYNEHRQHHVEHRRVAHVSGGMVSGGHTIAPRVMKSAHKRASGGRVDGSRDAMAVVGAPTRQRLDKPMRARGGRTKHKGQTHVNVIVAPQGHSAVPPPSAGMAAPAAMPRPPVVPPGVGGAPPMPPPGMPPMGPRKTGGRTYASGGAVKSGPAWESGRRAGTQVQHTNNKLDGHNVGRGKPMTYATGGAIEHPAGKKGMAPHLPGGGKGGLARLAKAHRAARGR